MSTDTKVLPLLPLCLSLRVPQHNSLSHLCARHFTRNDSNIAYQHIFSSFSCTLAPGSCEEGCKPLLYQLRVSQVVCGPPPRAPPTSPHFPAWPSSRAPAHPPPLFLVTGTVRHLSLFLRWTDAPRFSLSNTRSRCPPPPPSTLRVRGHCPLLLHLYEIEDTALFPPSTLRVRGTSPYPLPSTRGPGIHLPSICL